MKRQSKFVTSNLAESKPVDIAFVFLTKLMTTPYSSTKTQISDVWNSTPNVHASGPPILSETSTALTDASKILYHRGPDGMQTSRGVYGPQRWSMGHTRLAIVDPSNRQADM